MIEIENLTKKFGSFVAVDNINLSIDRGKIFAFLGTNGAGKTTTIRMMTGVLEPSGGTVRIGGYDIQKNPIEAKFLMGVIPDRPYLYGKLTGREFLHFMADLYKTPYKTALDRIGILLDTYGLEEWQHDLIDSYSHGMKQRLLMCAAQVHDPAVLVVDEPMVGLDPRGAKLLKDTFKKKASEGLTIFMSTHSLSVAQEVADQLAIIQHGKIIAKGSLQDLFSRAKQESSDLENVFLQLIAEAEEQSGVVTKNKW
ncbi:MAG: ABC transporter ATP-binding protein [Deltaproteobacteria bacterium]|nr:ABC transporter ATP-binding protein [Deltaproteobacteria bacterium]